MDVLAEVRAYRPFNEQEQADQALILHCLQEGPGIFYRENHLAHMTASAWVVDAARTSVLMAYHNIYNSWAWLGGHADGEQDLLRVAMREVREESGLKTLYPVTRSVYSLEVLTVDGHIKRGAYVSSHLHLNLTYLLQADKADTLFVKQDENSGVRWFSLEEAVKASSEPWMREHIYAKLNEKLTGFKP